MLALLQFDSASTPVIERLLAEDRLPAIAELRRAGTLKTLGGSNWHLGDTVFPTLYTGTGPGDHGCYYPLQWSASEQRVRHVDSLAKGGTTVWERLSRAGRRSLVIDPFVSWRPDEMRGLCISGWQFRHRLILQRWSVPRRATYTLARELGRPARLEQVMGTQSAREVQALHRGYAAAPGRAADLVDSVLARERPDLLWITFPSVHLAGHAFWLAPDLLEDVYVAADRALERILASLPAGTDVLLFSPTGMGLNCSRSDMLPEMLDAVLEGPGRARNQSPGSRIWRYRASVMTTLRTSISNALPGPVLRDLLARFYLQGVDWTRTQAFTVPGHTHGLVRLNMRGREREGIVDPGDADALMDEIATGLQSFNDPGGAPAVAAVERVADAISGPNADGLPDLIVRWSEQPSKNLTFVSSERHGTIQRRGVGSGWTGNHVEGAWIVLPEPIDRQPRIIDIAATACALTGTGTTGLAGEPLLAAR